MQVHPFAYLLWFLYSYFFGVISHQIFERDIRYVTAHLTFDHLMRMCDDRVVVAPEKPPLRIHPSPPDNLQKNWTVEQLPFPFDILELLPKSRQVEMVFSSLIETLTQSKCVIFIRKR